MSKDQDQTLSGMHNQSDIFSWPTDARPIEHGMG